MKHTFEEYLQLADMQFRIGASQPSAEEGTHSSVMSLGFFHGEVIYKK
jgi:hypothetical protein